MRRTLSIILSLASAALLSLRCTEPEDFRPDTPVTLSPALGIMTRAAIDGTSYPDTLEMVVAAWYNAIRGSSGNYFSGAVFTHDGDAWDGGDDPRYWPVSGTLDFLAYSAHGLAPLSRTYSAKVSDGVTLVLPDNGTVQSDILHGSASAQTKLSPGNPVLFRHAEALLVFVASSTIPYDAAANVGVTLDRVVLLDAYHAGTLAITASPDEEHGYCRWTSLSARRPVALAAGQSATTALAYNVPGVAMDISAAGCHMGIGGRGILVPEQSQSSFRIEYTLHNGMAADGVTPLDVTLEYTYDCSDVWSEGCKYLYSLRFDLEEVLVSPTVMPWTSSDTSVSIPEE